MLIIKYRKILFSRYIFVLKYNTCAGSINNYFHFTDVSFANSLIFTVTQVQLLRLMQAKLNY